MMKVFSKCLVVLFGLMLFFGNIDSCYGMKENGQTIDRENKKAESKIKNRNLRKEQEGKAAGIGNIISNICFGNFSTEDKKMKFLYISGPFLITMIASGILGYSPYKYILGGFNIYTCNIPSFLPKFSRFFLQIGLSYKINNKFSIIIFGLSTIKALICLISLIFKQNMFLLKYLNMFDIGVVSIEFSKWFSLRIGIGSLIISCFHNGKKKFSSKEVFDRTKKTFIERKISVLNSENSAEDNITNINKPIKKRRNSVGKPKAPKIEDFFIVNKK